MIEYGRTGHNRLRPGVTLGLFIFLRKEITLLVLITFLVFTIATFAKAPIELVVYTGVIYLASIIANIERR